MEAGRELDARIAVEIMQEIDGPIVRYIGGKIESLSGALIILQSYSTEIEDAWQVVERMRELGFDVGIRSVDTSWRCTLQRRGRSWLQVSNTAPHAICLAALQAVGQPESQNAP